MKLNKNTLKEAGGLTVGAVVAAKVANVNLPMNLPAPVKSALPLIVGVFLAGQKGFVGDVGKGMIAVGGVKLLNAVAPNLGIGAEGDDDGMGAYQIEGASDYALAGPSYALADDVNIMEGVDNPDGGANFGGY